MLVAASAGAATHQAGLVKDINPGSAGSFPLGSAVNGTGIVYFTASDATHGNELWKSDGTTAGTTLVKDINPGAGDSEPFDLTNLNGTVYFSATDGTTFELWKSDGTESGTEKVTHLSSTGGNCCDDLIKIGTTLYLSADDGTNGQELWKSDGTEPNTQMVMDINPVGDSNPGQLTDVGGTLFFKADDGTNGSELWTSDGTEPNTQMVKDINPSGHSFADSLTDVGGTLYFNADDGTNGRELWTSDGTEPNTQMVKDINPSGSSGPGDFADVGGTMYFAANGTDGRELWKSNGTEPGTTMVKDIWPGVDGSFPYQLTNVDGTLFLGAEDPTTGRELWESDGTGAGTELVRDIWPGPDFGGPDNLVNANGTLFFGANDGTNGVELWRTFQDTTPPSGGVITTNLPAFRLTTPFQVAWGGATDAGSGVASYKAIVKKAPYNAGFGPPTVVKTTSGPGSASFGAKPANTYCFYVRVADKVGNTSAPSAQKCTSMPVDDATLAGSGWTRRTGKLGYYRGTYSQNSTKGAVLTLGAVQAKRLALVAVTCPGCGTVQVFQGTTLLKQVNLAATNVEHRIIAIASFPSVHSGNVRIKVTTAGKPVIIDGLGVSRSG